MSKGSISGFIVYHRGDPRLAKGPRNPYVSILVGDFYEEGGSDFEFQINWYEVVNRKGEPIFLISKHRKQKMTLVRLEISDEAWSYVFGKRGDEMYDNLFWELSGFTDSPTIDDVVKLLEEIGFEEFD